MRETRHHESEEGNGGFEFSGFGATLKAYGRDILLILQAVTIVGALVFIYEEMRLNELEALNFYSQLEAEHIEVKELMNRILRESEVQNWLMAIPFEDRPKIIPPEVQERIQQENDATSKLLKDRQRQKQRRQ